MTPKRVVVLLPSDGPDHELLPRSTFAEQAWIFGGVRSMHELAFAAAASGIDVELRGWIDRATFDQLRCGSEIAPSLADTRRLPRTGDVIVVPEGHENPLVYGRKWLSGAQLVLLALGPVGLLGWPFVAEWNKRPPLTATARDINRPESFRALAAMGIPLWSNSRVVADAARAFGVDASFIGHGRPMHYPEGPAVRPVDVAWLADNRWAPLARPLAERLSCVVEEIGAVSHAEMLQRLGQARVLLYPGRIEGESRVLSEARAVGTVPVVVSGNPVATQIGPEHGVVAVEDAESLLGAISELLSDGERLARLSRAAITSARAASAWAPFVERVGSAFRSLPSNDPAGGARAVIGARLGGESARLESEVEQSRAATAQLKQSLQTYAELEAELERVRARMVELDVELDRVRRRKDEAEAELQALRGYRIRWARLVGRRQPHWKSLD